MHKNRSFWWSLALSIVFGCILLVCAVLLDRPGVEPSLGRPVQLLRSDEGEPVKAPATPDRGVVGIPGRVAVPPRQLRFVVHAADASADLSGTSVIAARPGFHSTRGVLLGRPGPDGSLDVVYDAALEQSEFFARRNGAWAKFEQVAASEGQATYRATFLAGSSLRVRVVSQQSVPIVGAVVGISRLPVPASEAALLSEPDALSLVPGFGEPRSAVFTCATDAQGYAVFDGLSVGDYFYSVEASGVFPWRCEAGYWLSCPGNHEVKVDRAWVAALVVSGDEVVSSRLPYPFRLDQANSPHLIDFKSRIESKVRDCLVCVVPESELGDVRRISAELFLAQGGATVVDMPLVPWTPDYMPMALERKPEVGKPRAASVVAVRSKQNPQWARPIRWTLRSNSGEFFRKESADGGDMLVPPGQYTVTWSSRVLSERSKPATFFARGGMTETIELMLPTDCVQCRVEVSRNGRMLDVPSRSVIRVRDGDKTIEDGYSGAFSDLWLPEGRFEVTVLMGFPVDSAEIVVTADDVSAHRQVVVRLNAKD
jgi:hypothetical protein